VKIILLLAYTLTNPAEMYNFNQKLKF